MKDINPPAISVVIVTPDIFETISKTINYLNEQTARDRMEVVIVAPSEDGLNLNSSKLIDSLRIKVVEVNNIKSIAQAKAAGIRQAAAPNEVVS